MSNNHIELKKITFSGPQIESTLEFTSGVNVICGASDTGKSFFAETIDFMLGSSDLRDISERSKYAEIRLDLNFSDDGPLCLQRSTSGGDFKAKYLESPTTELVLKQKHFHERTDNLSGFLLEKIGLLGKRVLKSSAQGTTQSLSFRNLAKLVIVQEGEIQQRGSPFWSGQFTTKTSELATTKLLLTGIDDSSVVSAIDTSVDNERQIALIEELIAELATEIEEQGNEYDELKAQFKRLESTLEERKKTLTIAQGELEKYLLDRRQIIEIRQSFQTRLDEITDLFIRFYLLKDHYDVDLERLEAVRESGSMFVHVRAIVCPLCGALPEAHQTGQTCDDDVAAIIVAATVEMAKINKLKQELIDTVNDLQNEATKLKLLISEKDNQYKDLDSKIQKNIAPEVNEARNTFAELIEERSTVQRSIDLYERVSKLEKRKIVLQNEGEEPAGQLAVSVGIPESVTHSFSQKISLILKAWNFPGECHVYFDKQSSDFVIDGKPRGSRGKGLRAITHAAVTIGLMEFCQERGLPHPGFVVLDSPLLAYFKPEGDEDLLLKGTDLKERFYEYLIAHHRSESQIIIVENQHPPESMDDKLNMIVFTGNPNDGRLGFL